MINIGEILAKLSAIDPQLPAVACAGVVLGVFFGMYAVRKTLPKFWEWCANLLPFLRVADDSKRVEGMKRALRKVWQSIPSLVAGAVAMAAIAGTSIKAAALGAGLGAVAPIVHEVGKWCPWIKYRGETKKAPPVDLTVLDITQDERPPSSRPPT